MTDQPANTGAQGGEQLFQGMDEQERLYAPEEVPGTDLPVEEVDRGGTAASGSAVASYEAEQVTEPADDERGAVPAAARHPDTGMIPIAPTRPDTTTKTDEDELDRADTEGSRA